MPTDCLFLTYPFIGVAEEACQSTIWITSACSAFRSAVIYMFLLVVFRFPSFDSKPWSENRTFTRGVSVSSMNSHGSSRPWMVCIVFQFVAVFSSAGKGEANKKRFFAGFSVSYTSVCLHKWRSLHADRCG